MGRKKSILSIGRTFANSSLEPYRLRIAMREPVTSENRHLRPTQLFCSGPNKAATRQTRLLLYDYRCERGQLI